MQDGYSQLVAMPGAITAVDVQAALTPQATEDWFFENGLFGSKSDSGERVNPTTALGHGPVWQAVNILAGDVGQLPFHKMVQKGRDRHKDRNHPIEWVLNNQPNPWQTPSVWKETMMHYALLWGNAVSVIQPIGRGRVWLLPLMPDCTHYDEIAPGEFVITTRINNEERAFPYENCFHLRGLQSNGFWGMSAIDVARNVLGFGLALQRHGNRTFKNDATPRGVIQTDNSFNADAHKNLRKEWYELQGGANQGSVAVLWEGLKFMPISMSNEDAQWLEARKLDREFVASLFNLPAFKLNALENSAVRANLEEQNRDYFQTSLSRWTNRFAEEAKRKLLTPRESDSGRHWFKWFPEAFLRGDIEKRFAAYGSAITNRIMSPNEVREKEDLNPYDGGDEYLNPAIDTATGSEQQDQAEHASAVQQQHARKLIQERVEKLLAAEGNRVKRGCAAKDFVKWATSFYDGYGAFAEEFLQLVCDMAESVGVKASWWKAVESHAIENLQMCLSHSELTTESPAILESQIANQHHKLTSSILEQA